MTDELRRLRDRADIVDLHDRFAAIMDAADYDALGQVLALEIVFEGWDPAPWHGLATAIRRFSEQDKHVASHRMISNHRIALDGDRARVIAHYRSSHLNRVDGPEGYAPHSHEGWYRSELRRGSDGWRFTRMKHIPLATAVNTTDLGRLTIEEIYRAI